MRGCLVNLEGIVPFSPGLPQRGYPGKEAPIIATPNAGLRFREATVVMVKPNGETLDRD